MKTFNIKVSSASAYRVMMISTLLMLVYVLSIMTANAQNPWTKGHKPLIDDQAQSLSIDNTWGDTTNSQTENVIDESKYPPMDENVTLQTDPFGSSTSNRIPLDSLPAQGGSETTNPNSQAYGQVPVYPSSRQQSMPGYSGNSQYPQYPQYRQGYQSAYPDYQRGYRSGYGRTGGFPFGNGYGNTFPFGGRNWMPFSDSGFW